MERIEKVTGFEEGAFRVREDGNGSFQVDEFITGLGWRHRVTEPSLDSAIKYTEWHKRARLTVREILI